MAQTLNDAIQEKSISSMILGYHPSTGLKPLFKRPLHSILLENNQRLEVVLQPLSDSINQKPLGQDVYFSLLSLKEIFFILMVTFTSIILARIAEVYVGVDDLSIIFIVAVLLVATKTRMLAAVITAMLFSLPIIFSLSSRVLLSRFQLIKALSPLLPT